MEEAKIVTCFSIWKILPTTYTFVKLVWSSLWESVNLLKEQEFVLYFWFDCFSLEIGSN